MLSCSAFIVVVATNTKVTFWIYKRSNRLIKNHPLCVCFVRMCAQHPHKRISRLSLCPCVVAPVWGRGAQSAAVLVHVMARSEDSWQGPTPAGAGAGSGKGQRRSPTLQRPYNCALQVQKQLVCAIGISSELKCIVAYGCMLGNKILLFRLISPGKIWHSSD